MNIDWNSKENHIFFNPYLKGKNEILKKLSDVDSLHAHVWISTSGTSLKNGGSKWVALSKEALLLSAKAVNEHLQANAQDTWLLALPIFHVGGIALSARCHISGASLIDLKGWKEKWDPFIYTRALAETKSTLSALVPTQLYDLVNSNLKPPDHLRAVVIGGASLNRYLYKQARGLGWNVLPSYGMTECSSQVATAELKSLLKDSFPKLKLLNHVKVQVNPQGCLAIKSPSLFTYIATIEEETLHLKDPKIDGIYTTEDQGVVQGSFLQVKGRVGEIVKISGENVDMQKLQNLLDEIKMQLQIKGEQVLTAIPDDRLGNSICMAVSKCSKDAALPLQQAFNEAVMPFERIRHLKKISQIPRSPLGKVLQGSLLKMIVCQLIG